MTYYIMIFSGHTLFFNTLFATLEKTGTQNMIYQASALFFHRLDVKLNP